jgi:hypothetical protein
MDPDICSGKRATAGLLEAGHGIGGHPSPIGGSDDETFVQGTA